MLRVPYAHAAPPAGGRFACLWRVVAQHKDSDEYFGMPPPTYEHRLEFAYVYHFDIYIAVAMLLGETIGVPSAHLQVTVSVTAMLVSPPSRYTCRYTCRYTDVINELESW